MKRNRMRIVTTLAVLVLLMIAGTVRKASSAEKLPDNWLTDWDKAVAEAKKSEKNILAVFSTSWCGPCQQMIRDVYPKPEVKSMLEKEWVSVYIDGDKYPKRLEEYGVTAFPTFIIFSSDAEEEDRFVGARPQEPFLKVLRGHKESVAMVKELKAGLQETPEDPKLWKAMGKYLESKQKMTEALEAFEKAASLDPEGETGAAADVYFLKALPESPSDFEKSKETMDGFEAKFPKADARLPEVWLYRAWLTANLGDEAGAVELLKQGIERFSDSDTAESMRYVLGQLQ